MPAEQTGSSCSPEELYLAMAKLAAQKKVYACMLSACMFENYFLE